MMVAPLLDQRDIDFLLYEVFEAETLTNRERYRDHSRETFDAAINTARTVAEKHLLPIRRQVDSEEPQFENGSVTMPAVVEEAVKAIFDAGLAAAGEDYERGGMQLPGVVAAAARAYLNSACCSVVSYAGLTEGNANLIQAHGSDAQVRQWVEPMRSGLFTGTMALTEPGAGSSVGDITTRAERTEQGDYRITGTKIFISGGDHTLSENIVHLVLARVRGAPAGVKGISLFIVPKYLVNEDGSIGERNDVALTGLFHKLGWHGITSTALSFGEKGGAIGYLVGEENKGLTYMFHMMNEARVSVGTVAAATAATAYQYALDYARERPQGRLPSSKTPTTPPVPIIEHADVKRMLLAQKTIAEGALALCLYGAQLADDEKTAPDKATRQRAAQLLDTLTPVIKSWPSEFGPQANSLAMQVLGGHGYINEHPVEMLYRDNRLNAIHEGTTGIQAIDLLGRKVPMAEMAGYRAFLAEMESSCDEAMDCERLTTYADQLREAMQRLDRTTTTLLEATKAKAADQILANATHYLDAFGHVVIAWIWLRQGIIADKALAADPHPDDERFYRGKLQALRYFYYYELTRVHGWCELLSAIDLTCYDMQAEWF